MSLLLFVGGLNSRVKVMVLPVPFLAGWLEILFVRFAECSVRGWK